MRSSPPTPRSQDVRLLSAASYLIGFWSLIFLFLKPHGETVHVRFHAAQATLLSLMPWAAAVLIRPFQVQNIHSIRSWAGPLVGIAYLVMILGLVTLVSIMISAYLGRRAKFPLLGYLAGRFAQSRLLR